MQCWLRRLESKRSGRDDFFAEQVVEEGTTAIDEKHFAGENISRRGEAVGQFSESVNDTGFRFNWEAVVKIGQPPTVIAPEVSADESPFPATKSPGTRKRNHS